jgi:crossover junction endodeoxyribonuclease RusA
MSVEIAFPFEFVVEGTPVSAQRRRPESVRQWQSRITEASRRMLPEGHFANEAPISVILYSFPSAPMLGNIDNIVRPFLNVICRMRS